jgi:hypothetical protein
MNATLLLAGFYVVLWLPFIGHLIEHAIQHLIEHQFDHHEARTILTLSGIVLFLFLAIPTLLLFRQLYLALDAFLLLLIMVKIFNPKH